MNNRYSNIWQSIRLHWNSFSYETEKKELIFLMYLKNVGVYLDLGMAGSRYPNHVIKKRVLSTSQLCFSCCLHPGGLEVSLEVIKVSSAAPGSYPSSFAASKQTVSFSVVPAKTLGLILISPF